MSTQPDQQDERQASSAGESPGASESRTPWYGSNWVLIAYSAILIILFCIIGFISNWQSFVDTLQNPFQRPSLWSVSEETPSVLISPTSPNADTKSTCVIIWAEHQPDDLRKKSRATVWVENVRDPVKASRIAHRECYKLVVEHNPQLIRDEYEFKKGKTYFLPECQ